MDRRDLQPQTEYLAPDCRLLSDLRPTAKLNSKPAQNLQVLLHQVTLSSLDNADAGRFGKQAQSVSILDRLLLTLRLTVSNKETKLAELAELDSTIRSFLKAVMGGELECRPSLHVTCIPVALCVRQVLWTTSFDYC
jgi:hypothetical protein